MTRKKLQLLGTLFLAVLVFNSCIKSSVETDEKRVAVEFTVNSLAEDIQVGEDIIQIDEFKFSIDRFNLYASEEVVLQTNSDVTALIFAYNEDIVGTRLILDVGLGFSDVEVFEGYEMFLEPMRNRSNILDADFFDDPENFSLIIKGQVNNVDFEFKFHLSFEKLFEIPSVQLNENNETLLLSKSIDIKPIFVDESGSFLDPNNLENEANIVHNIQENLKLSAIATSLF